MLISPPFAFLLGMVGAVVLWIALGEVDLPGWARLGLSLMAIPAVPGLWFLLLPVLFGATSVVRAGGDELTEWRDHQMKVWQDHEQQLRALGRQPIERVLASGSSVTASGVTITLIAVALGKLGGDLSLAHAATVRADDECAEVEELMAEVTDDIGTRYVVMASPLQMVAVGARTHIAFFPAVPPEATELRLHVAKIFRLGEVDALAGPWELTVQVAPDGTTATASV